MKIRIANWNVNRRGDLTDHLSLLDSVGWDVCTLQEVQPQAAAGLISASVEGSHALDHAHGTARLAGVRAGAMVLARAPFRLRGAGVVAELPSPDRSLLARIGSDEDSYFGMSLLSAALPPATSWGALKVEQCLGIVRLLKRRRAPMVVGIDANTPKNDHTIPDKVEYWWPEEAELLGPRPAHNLRDVYRTLHSDGAPKQMPVSIEMNGVPRRYDYVLASPEFTVASVEYRFDDEIKRLSDRGLVLASLS